jgi:hypothetical protein
MYVSVGKPTRLGLRSDISAQEERASIGFSDAVAKTKLRLSVKDPKRQQDVHNVQPVQWGFAR